MTLSKLSENLKAQMDDLYSCPLCQRIVPKVSDHHLIPKSRGGADTLPICLDCHNAVHAFFTNKELEETYHSVEKLLSDEKFEKHIKWLAKQNPNKRHKSKRVREKKRRNRGG